MRVQWRVAPNGQKVLHLSARGMKPFTVTGEYNSIRGHPNAYEILNKMLAEAGLEYDHEVVEGCTP
jgi:hypothetical protein